MILPELRSIHSLNLEPPALPPDPLECKVDFQVVIGPRGAEESEAFTFTVITPALLARSAEPVWGRGYLIIATFEWETIVHAVARLLADSAAPTWSEVIAELGRSLQREVARNGGNES